MGRIRSGILTVSVIVIVKEIAWPILGNLISGYLYKILQSISPPIVAVIVAVMSVLCIITVIMKAIYRKYPRGLSLRPFKVSRGRSDLQKCEPPDSQITQCTRYGFQITYDPVSRDPEACIYRNVLDDWREKSRIHSRSGMEGSRIHAVEILHVALKVHADRQVPEVEAALASEYTTRSSRILHRRFEIGPQTSDHDLEVLSSQIAKTMKLARGIDKNCTLQFGSFAFFKYTDGKLKQWKLREEWTPVIYDIRRSPWNIFTGEGPKWIIRGSNLEEATLKASTSDKKEEITIEDRCKMENGEDELVCAEPRLIWQSALMFWKGVYICAWNSVTEEGDGLTFNLQSESRNVTRAYWISVAKGLRPSPSTMIMIVAYLLVERMLGSVIRGTRVAIVEVVSTVVATATTTMEGAVAPWFEWSYAYAVVAIAMVVATVVFKLVWKSTENTSASSSHLELPPKGVTKLNDSLYQLYEPESGKPDIDIIFFHGLQASDYTNAYWKCWMSKDGKILWPQALLGKKYPNARILSVSYDSATNVTGTSGRVDLSGMVENYVEDIIFSHLAIGVNRPVVLVGHSLGGLLLKKFVMFASHMKTKVYPKTDAKKIATIDNFFANVWGVFYYSTPHNGTRLADIASKIQGTSKALVLLKTVGKDSSRLNYNFALWRKENDVKAMSLVEGLPTDPQIWGVKGTKPSIIVEEGSCRNDTDSFYTIVDANHITICQPNNNITGSFRKFEQFLNQCMEEKVANRLEDPIAPRSTRGYILDGSKIWQDPKHLGVGGT